MNHALAMARSWRDLAKLQKLLGPMMLDLKQKRGTTLALVRNKLKLTVRYSLTGTSSGFSIEHARQASKSSRLLPADSLLGRRVKDRCHPAAVGDMTELCLKECCLPSDVGDLWHEFRFSACFMNAKASSSIWRVSGNEEVTLLLSEAGALDRC